MDLTSVKLRKVSITKVFLNKISHTQHDPAPDRSRVKTDDDFFRLMRETYMEEYFEHTKAEEAIALTAAHDSTKFNSDQDWSSNAVLISLSKKIEIAKAELDVEAVFVRTSSRSPKDGIFSSRSVPIFRAALKSLHERYQGRNDPFLTKSNYMSHALYKMSTEAMRVTNGMDAINLMVHSARLQEDLHEYISHPDQRYQLCIREFAKFEVELEFRGFVYKGKLTALTQYNEACYFPDVVSNKDYIAETIKTWTESKLIGKLPLESFVVDFILISMNPTSSILSNLRVIVVEINPFAEFAGSGLFRWEVALDSDILHGESPFEFRVVTEPPRHVLDTLPSEWKAFLQLAMFEDT